MDRDFSGFLLAAERRCGACLSPLPSRRWRWCDRRCQSFAQSHPNDFRRLFQSCRFCGIEIDHLREGRRFCTRACLVRAGEDRLTARRHAERQTILADRGCGYCKSPLEGRRANAKFCSSRCSEIANGQRLPTALPQRTCALAECGAAFQPRRRIQRCCSEKHGKLLYNRESRADGRQKPPPWSDARRDRYHRRRAQKKAAATGEPVLLADIADRDRWHCSLCSHPVDPSVAWPDSSSPSLDHRVPLSKGGAHDPSNVFLAHLGCNSSKGDRLLDDGPLLTG
ncbi:HNH endonuclease [Streptomyces sp. NPDC127040]|uniref:HNH endonuclease n=1 Tax=Streptomyces sp. NPDC127040 TaxID=3347116 RepID=UPI00364ACBBF